MITAWAAQKAGGPLTPFEYDPGPLGPHDVDIDVQYCGICHSDLSVINNEWGFSEYPVVGGHEVVGRVRETGGEVAHLEKGQTVGLGWHAGYCNTCMSCQSGDQNLCQTAQATIVGHHGGFADRVRAQAASVIPIPEGLNPLKMGPMFCGGITVFNPLVQYDISPLSRAAVIGIGGLGHLALQFLNAWGCHVTAFTSTPEKEEEAVRMGAHATLNSRDDKALERAAGQFDLIISTVNVTLDWNAYINTLAPKGRLHMVGAALEPMGIGAFGLIAAQRSVSGSPVGSPATIRHMLDFSERHDIAPVVETFEMKDINVAFDHLKSGDARYRIVLKN